MPHRRLTVRGRILAGFAVVALLLGGELWLAMSGLARIREIREALSAEINPRVAAAEAFERSMLYRAIALRRFLLAETEPSRAAYEARRRDSVEALERLRAVSTDDETRGGMAGIEARFQHFERVRDEAFARVRHWDPTAPEALAAERALVDAREALLDEVRAWAAVQIARQAELRLQADRVPRELQRALILSAGLVLAVVLATALLTDRAVRLPAARLARSARALEAGDFEPALAAGRAAPAGGDELDEVVGAFGRMAAGLRRREERLAAEGRIAAALGSSLDVQVIAGRALDEIVRFTGVELAAIHVVHPAGALRRIAGSGAPAAAADLPRDGIAGEALARRRTVLVEDAPGATGVALGLGSGAPPPRVLAAVPLLLGPEEVGVVVLGSVRALAPEALPFVEHAATQLAIAARNALAHERTVALAEALRDANDRLQAQNVDLEEQRRQLQAQTGELHAQAHEIQRQNERLRASKDELDRRTLALEEVDRRKGEFLATLGHELRSPLAAMLNAAHLIEAGCEGGRVARHAAIVSRQGWQLRRLVDDLLDVARINRGKIELRPEPLDARAVVTRALEESRPALDAKRHRVEVSLPEAPLALEGDPVRLQQVLSNLLQNAAKYTPDGGDVAIAAAEVDGGCELTIRDSGIGIPPDLLPRVFEPFTQGDHAQKQGLGLGLALVQQLVRLHGGEVSVRSDGPGRGAEFAIRLPLSRAASALPSPSAADLVARPPGALPRSPVAPAGPAGPADRAAGAAEGRRLRVLVVDDNEDLAETTALVVETFGHEVQVVNGAAAALAACAGAAAPDVALLDIGLPEMDGYQLATELRRLADGGPRRLVAVTGYAQPEDRTRAHAAGFDLHLAKPVDGEELRNVLARYASELASPAAQFTNRRIPTFASKPSAE